MGTKNVHKPIGKVVNVQNGRLKIYIKDLEMEWPLIKHEELTMKYLTSHFTLLMGNFYNKICFLWTNVILGDKKSQFIPDKEEIYIFEQKMCWWKDYFVAKLRLVLLSNSPTTQIKSREDCAQSGVSLAFV